MFAAFHARWAGLGPHRDDPTAGLPSVAGDIEIERNVDLPIRGDGDVDVEADDRRQPEVILIRPVRIGRRQAICGPGLERQQFQADGPALACQLGVRRGHDFLGQGFTTPVSTDWPIAYLSEL